MCGRDYPVRMTQFITTGMTLEGGHKQSDPEKKYHKVKKQLEDLLWYIKTSDDISVRDARKIFAKARELGVDGV